MKLLILLGTIAAALGVSAAQTCTTYNGDQCTSVFGTANITGSATIISTTDTTISTYFTTLSTLSISQACQNYRRFIQCLIMYRPCTGTAWCGSMSLTELTTALNNACDCTGTSCTVTAPPLINYYQGSSSGGRVKSNMLTCQDVSVGVSAATCTTYNGDQCTSVFGTANVIGSATTISAADGIINTYLTGLSTLSISQSCQNFFRFIQCLTVYIPCPGTAWCSSMSPTELTTALNNACDCIDSSCTFAVPTLRNYYQGSSSGGRVNNNMLTCQDVSVDSSAGTIKMSMMGAALVAILLSIALLL